MGYTTDDQMVRVDFFRPSGRWYTTEQLKWDRYFTNEEDGSVELIMDTFDRCLVEQFFDLYVKDRLYAICLEPYHEHAFPLMLRSTI